MCESDKNDAARAINFYTALLNAQTKIGRVTKDKINPYHKSKYADINDLLAVVKPILNNEGLLLLQPLTTLDGLPALSTIITGHGNTIEYVTVIPHKDDPQRAGSVITYYRRYALQAMLSLEVEDDDGEAARVSAKPTPKPTAKPTAKPATNDPKKPDEPEVVIPTCSLCGKPMHPQAANKNKFYCRHEEGWGLPVYPAKVED